MDIDYPRFGEIVVEGQRYPHDVMIEGGEVRPRDKGPSKQSKARYGHTPLTAAESIPWTGERLIIGSGYAGRLPVVEDVLDEARRRGVELVVVSTAEACEMLASIDPADVYAVLHVTC